MGLLTEERLQERVKKELKGIEKYSYRAAEHKANRFINESIRSQRIYISKKYDVFLSHSSKDAKHVAGVKLLLEDQGFTVYIDWIEDPEVDRSKVNENNAELLRNRMKQCEALLYAFSKNALNSKWMPWELGYFDGTNGKVAIVPITKNKESNFKGTEYLGLYPYIDSTESVLWINKLNGKFENLKEWIK